MEQKFSIISTMTKRSEIFSAPKPDETRALNSKSSSDFSNKSNVKVKLTNTSHISDAELGSVVGCFTQESQCEQAINFLVEKNGVDPSIINVVAKEPRLIYRKFRLLSLKEYLRSAFFRLFFTMFIFFVPFSYVTYGDDSNYPVILSVGFVIISILAFVVAILQYNFGNTQNGRPLVHTSYMQWDRFYLYVTSDMRKISELMVDFPNNLAKRELEQYLQHYKTEVLEDEYGRPKFGVRVDSAGHEITYPSTQKPLPKQEEKSDVSRETLAKTTDQTQDSQGDSSDVSQVSVPQETTEESADTTDKKAENN